MSDTVGNRGAGRIVHSLAPLNAEPTAARLRATFVTAPGDFYVRSHGDIPSADPRHHRLRIDGLVATPLAMTVDELRRRFAPASVRAVLQCAGNRRADLQSVRPTTGDPWGPGAIGFAGWTGVRLADVLEAAGIDRAAGSHVAFECLDRVGCEAAADAPGAGERPRFGVSIPIAKAMSPEVLVAFEMDGRPLPPEHGAPARLVVPGFAGVRSPKWVSRITVRDRPSDNDMQARDYKLLPPDMEADDIDWSRGITIDAMPLNSAICEPAAGAILAPGTRSVRGYAVSTGRAVTRIDLSCDGGTTWMQASLEAEDGGPWGWVFWHATVGLEPGAHELVVRAWDEAGQTQPASPTDVWNVRGYLSAAWHRVRVTVG